MAILVATVGACGAASTSGTPTGGANGGSTATPAAAASAATTASPQAGGGGGSGVADACSLVTPAQVSAATNRTVTAANPVGGGAGQAFCAYVDANGANVVATGIATGPGEAAAFEGFKAVPGYVAVSGLGDAALWLPGANQLYVKKGDALYLVQPDEGIGDDNARLTAAKAIAAAAVAKL
ncbi:MAG: hypothetical protein ACXWPO_02175 [Candidatus Limnocylindrales bacterium]